MITIDLVKIDVFFTMELHESKVEQNDSGKDAPDI